MPGVKGVNGIALGAVGFGGILIWSGIKGWSVLSTLQDLVTGTDPKGLPVVDPITDTAGTGPGGTTSGDALAARAQQDVGHCYFYGGSAFKARRDTPSGGSGKAPSCWDCSSAVNWWCASTGFAIPGYKPGQYDGTVHGPPTGSWIGWSGCRTIKRSEIRAGDIMVWQTHMGIAISNTHMISALNPKLGTMVTTIKDGAPGGEILVPRRLNAITGSTAAGGPAPKGSYDHAGLMKLWQQAGGSAATANNAACHAIQESSGNPAVTSQNPDGGVNVGLWQLDTKGKGAGYTVAQLQNPLLNARVAIKGTSGGRDWSAWATPGC